MMMVYETIDASQYVTQEKAEAKCAELANQHKDHGFQVHQQLSPHAGLRDVNSQTHAVVYIISVSAADGEFLGFYRSENKQ